MSVSAHLYFLENLQFLYAIKEDLFYSIHDWFFFGQTLDSQCSTTIHIISRSK